MKLKMVSTDLEERQIDLLDKISSKRLRRAEHIRRAIDMYLSQPAIQVELKGKKKV